MPTLILALIILALVGFAFSRSYFMKHKDCGCGHGDACVTKEKSTK